MAGFASQASIAVLSAALSTTSGVAQTEFPSAPEFTERSTLYLNAQTAELTAISRTLAATQEAWKSLPEEADTRLRGMAENLSVDGMTKSGASVQYVPGGYVLTTVRFTPNEDRQGLGSIVDPTVLERTKSGLSELRQLREEGYFQRSDVDFGIADNKDFVLRIISIPGDKALKVPKLEAPCVDVSTEEGRATMWAENLAILGIGEATRSAEQIACASKGIESLRDFYEGTGEMLCARMAQGVLCVNAQGAEPFLRYLELGKISAAEMANLPAPIVSRVQHTNFIVRNIPLEAERQALRERASTIDPPLFLMGLIDLEQHSGIVTGHTADIARMEARNAIRFAKEEVSKLVHPSAADGLKIIRSYFEVAYPSDYRFRDPMQGVATGLTLRRTDCSTRALLAMEMLNSMGFESGVEILGAERDGKPVQGVPGHMYNYVDGRDGKRIFADFCSPARSEYTFTARDRIIGHYLGDSDLSAAVALSSADRASIYGVLLREPVGQIITDFRSTFRSSAKDLVSFIAEHPEWRERVELLKRYSETQDQIFGTSEKRHWEAGTYQSIAELYQIGS